MKRKSMNRAIKKFHEINLDYFGEPIQIKKLLPLNQQENYNPILKEWYGPRQWEIIAETNAEFEAFKESEDWREIGTIGLHDYKCKINDNLGLALDGINNYIVKRLSDNKYYDILFYREFIGEVHLGLRPVINSDRNI